MKLSNFESLAPMLSIQELSNLSYTWNQYQEGEAFTLEGLGSYRLAKVINDSGYDAAVVEKLGANSLITDAAYLNQGSKDLTDRLQVAAIDKGSYSSQAILAAKYYQVSAEAYTDFTLKLSGHSLGGGLANYTLAKVVNDGGAIPETFTFAAVNAENLINKDFGKLVNLAGLSSNFVSKNDYYFGDGGGYSSTLLGKIIGLSKNIDGNGFTDQYILPRWEDGPGDAHNSHNKIFIDISSSVALTAYDNLNLEIRGSSAGTTLIGNSGANIIYGNDGDDIIIGRGGADQLWGGGGADTFVYQNINDSTPDMPDIIHDFTSGEDKIDISKLSSLLNDKASFTPVDYFTGSAGELLLSYDQLTDTGSVGVDFTGKGYSDFQINTVGHALISDLVIT